MKHLNLKSYLVTGVCLALAVMSVACSDDDKKKLPGEGDGVRKRTFESADYASGWKYFSFKKGNFIDTPAKPEESLDWDVAFNRYYVKTNSGTSGKGKGGCIDSEETDFTAVHVDKNAVFTVDDSLSIMTTMGGNGRDSYNPEIECEGSHSWAWYKYMESTWYYNRHVFVFRSANGENCARVIFDSYKDELGNSGHITFRYMYDGEQDADIDQPDEPTPEVPETPVEAVKDTLTINLMQSKWNYFSFAKGEFIELTEEQAKTSLDWDIAIDRFYMRTNSGTSGKGEGGALDMNKVKFEEVPNVPTSGYKVDEMLSMMVAMMGQKYEDVSGSPAYVCAEQKGAWFWSDRSTSTNVYNNNVFAIQTADGKHHAKLIMHNYNDKKVIFEYVYPAK